MRDVRLHSPATRDRGFALPLAVAVLVAVTLVVALIIDGAVAAFRSAGADLELARAESIAESALAAALEQRLDTIAVHGPAGATLRVTATGGSDSVTTTIQSLSGRVVRVVVTVRHVRGDLRLSVGRVAFAELVPAAGDPAAVEVTRLRDAWWSPIP